MLQSCNQQQQQLLSLLSIRQSVQLLNPILPPFLSIRHSSYLFILKKEKDNFFLFRLNYSLLLHSVLSGRRLFNCLGRLWPVYSIQLRDIYPFRDIFSTFETSLFFFWNKSIYLVSVVHLTLVWETFFLFKLRALLSTPFGQPKELGNQLIVCWPPPRPTTAETTVQPIQGNGSAKEIEANRSRKVKEPFQSVDPASFSSL